MSIMKCKSIQEKRRGILLLPRTAVIIHITRGSQPNSTLYKSTRNVCIDVRYIHMRNGYGSVDALRVFS